jgi:hypothetical protein
MDLGVVVMLRWQTTNVMKLKRAEVTSPRVSFTLALVSGKFQDKVAIVALQHLTPHRHHGGPIR